MPLVDLIQSHAHENQHDEKKQTPERDEYEISIEIIDKKHWDLEIDGRDKIGRVDENARV